MKRFYTIGICSLLALGVVWSTSCGPAEWATEYVPGKAYTVYFQMPKPFKKAEGWVVMKDGRRPFEHGYVTENEEHKFQFRILELPSVAWAASGFNRRAVLEMGLGRESLDADKIVDRQDFTDPKWPLNVSPAEELTIESADGKTIRYSRIVVYTGHHLDQCYVLLTATMPKGEPRSPDVDRFFNSLKITTDYSDFPVSETRDQ